MARGKSSKAKKHYVPPGFHRRKSMKAQYVDDPRQREVEFVMKNKTVSFRKLPDSRLITNEPRENLGPERCNGNLYTEEFEKSFVCGQPVSRLCFLSKAGFCEEHARVHERVTGHRFIKGGERTT